MIEGPEISRRKFLEIFVVGAGVATVNAMIPAWLRSEARAEGTDTVAPTLDSARMRDTIGNRLAGYRDRLIREHNVLNHGNPDRAFELAIKDQPLVTRAELEEMGYPVESIVSRYPFLLVLKTDEDGQPYIELVPPTDEYTPYRMLQSTEGYGQGVFITPDTLLIPGHVAAHIDPKGKEHWTARKSDSVFLRVPPECAVAWKHVIPVDFSLTHEQLEGALGLLVSANPNAWSDEMGRHAHPVVFVSGRHRALGEVLAAGFAGEERAFVPKSWAFRLPHGFSSKLSDEVVRGESVRPISGSSGGPVAVLRRNADGSESPVFAAMLWAADVIRGSDVGFALDVRAMRGALTGEHVFPVGVGQIRRPPPDDFLASSPSSVWKYPPRQEKPRT